MTRRWDLVAWTWPAAIAGLGAVLGLAAVLNPLLAIGGALAIAFVALVMADLTVGVVLFTFVTFLEVLPGIGGLSAAKLAGLVLVVSWVAATATSPAARRQMAAVHPGVLYLAAVFLAWVAMSALWSEDSGNAMYSFTRYAPNVLMLPIVFAGVQRRRDVSAIVIAFVAGALLSTVYGAFIAPGDPSDAGRLEGAGVDPNYLAVTLVAALALAAAVAFTRGHQPPARVAGAAVAALLGLGLLLTVSRGGLIALLAAVVAALVFAGRGRRLPLLAVAVVGLAAGAFYIAALAPQEARDHVTQLGNGSGRTDIWTVGMRMFQAQPLHGVGAGNFPNSSVHYLLEPGAILRDDFILDKPKVAHNVYLEVAAELGIVGFLLLMGLFGFCVSCAVRAAREFTRRGDVAMELLTRGLVVGLVGMLAASFFVSVEYLKQLWLLLALGPPVLAIARRGEKS